MGQAVRCDHLGNAFMRSRPTALGGRFGRLTLLNVLTNRTVSMASLVDSALLGHSGDLRFLASVALAAVLFEYIGWPFGLRHWASPAACSSRSGSVVDQ